MLIQAGTCHVRLMMAAAGKWHLQLSVKIPISQQQNTCTMQGMGVQACLIP